VGCWVKSTAKASDREPVATVGYTTCPDYIHGAQYEWVCQTCSPDFKGAMGWIETDCSNGAP